MTINRLTDNQFFLLEALAAQFDRASMSSMRAYIEDCYDKDISLGRQSEILERFEEQRLVESRWSEPGKGRGQRRKKIYRITGLGQQILAEERAARTAISDVRAGWVGGLA